MKRRLQEKDEENGISKSLIAFLNASKNTDFQATVDPEN
jgi:hypothetical protein